MTDVDVQHEVYHWMLGLSPDFCFKGMYNLIHLGTDALIGKMTIFGG
jgi:hypothetical protein